MIGRKTLLLISIFFTFSNGKKCVEWTPSYIDPDGPSMVYSETSNPNDGIGTQLSTYALLWQIRRNHNVDVFISKNCFEKLSEVFTPESLGDIPILEDYFCNSDKIQFEYFVGQYQALANEKSLKQGKTLFLWPNEERRKEAKISEVGGFVGYKPEEHGSEEHAKIRKDYIKWMKRKLEFQPRVQEKVKNTFESIARKLDFRPSQVTYIGMHNRRSKEFNEFFKKQNNKKPLKKGYWYDAMEDMRESYDNVAFLYVSDDMAWGRKNIKDKENDLYFVGQDDDAAFDFALLCQCNHTIVSRGAFTNWVSSWTGGEYYTEYGSIVPNEINDIINEEFILEKKRNGDESFVYGANTGDAEGLLFPDIKLEGESGNGLANTGSDDQPSSWLSWLGF